jgi:hypothetical protein
MTTNQHYQSLLTNILHWAKSQDDIKAIGLLGPSANNTQLLESEIKLIILAKDHKHYFENSFWLNHFGDVNTFQRQKTGKLTSLTAKYQNGAEIVFSFSNSRWAFIPPDKGVRKIVENGIKILYDPSYLLTKLIAFVKQDELECDKMYKDVRP